MPKSEIPTITVERLKQELSVFPDHYKLSFGGLRFYRLKLRGPSFVQVEFDQTIYLDDAGRVVVQNHE